MTEDFIQLPTNRSIAFKIHSNPDLDASKTVIFLPGAGFGRQTTPYDSSVLPKHSIRFIAIDRAGYFTFVNLRNEKGYGKTSPNPQGTLFDFADDLDALLTYLKIDRCYFIAHSAGCPRLLAFCFKYPNRVIRACVVCPPNPLVGNEVPEEVLFTRKVNKFLLLNIPGLMKFLLRTMVEKWAKDPREFLKDGLKKLFAPSEVEWLKRNPEYEKQVLREFSDAVQLSNANALVDDVVIAGQPWGFLLSQITCAVDVYSGSLDEVCPNAPWVAKTIPNARHFPKEGWGHAIIPIFWDEILTNLKD